MLFEGCGIPNSENLEKKALYLRSLGLPLIPKCSGWHFRPCHSHALIYTGSKASKYILKKKLLPVISDSVSVEKLLYINIKQTFYLFTDVLLAT